MLRHPHLVPLSHQHHDALALCVLVERSLLADGSAENLARQASKAVHFSATEGENHFTLEEEILFPLVEQTLGGHPMLDELRAEHAQLRELARRLAAQALREDLEAFVTLLHQHVRKEERDLFADVQERLPEDAFAIAGNLMKERMLQICVTG